MIKTLIIRNDIYNAKYLTSRHVKVSFERRRTFIIFLITVSQMMSFSSFYEKILIFLLVFFFIFVLLILSEKFSTSYLQAQTQKQV